MTRSPSTPVWRAILVCLIVSVPASTVIAQSDQKGAADSDKTSQEERSEAAAEASSRPGQPAATTVQMRKDRVVTATAPNVSPLVKAAASAASKAKATPARRFTDADLAGARGKLIIVEGSNVKEPEIIPVKEPTSETPAVVTNDHGERARAAQREVQAKALRSEIADLERAVRLLEDDYYMIEEEDHREVIEREFAAKRKALADAKARLEELEGGDGE